MIKLKVNGTARQFEGDPDTPLLWYLRDQLDLKGTKFGCGMGLCGACGRRRVVRSQPSRGSLRMVATRCRWRGRRLTSPSVGTARPDRSCLPVPSSRRVRTPLTRRSTAQWRVTYAGVEPTSASVKRSIRRPSRPRSRDGLPPSLGALPDAHEIEAARDVAARDRYLP
ncbi:MAG: hypothetical protein RLZZ20_2284 [Pseudomonadota bacterium]